MWRTQFDKDLFHAKYQLEKEQRELETLYWETGRLCDTVEPESPPSCQTVRERIARLKEWRAALETQTERLSQPRPCPGCGAPGSMANRHCPACGAEMARDPEAREEAELQQTHLAFLKKLIGSLDEQLEAEFTRLGKRRAALPPPQNRVLALKLADIASVKKTVQAQTREFWALQGHGVCEACKAAAPPEARYCPSCGLPML